MIWAVDGPDRVGKTTALLEAVRDKNYQVYVHSSNWPGTYYNWRQRIGAVIDLQLDAVMDRFFLSELAYSELRNEASLMTMGEASTLMHLYEKRFVPEVWLPLGADGPLIAIYDRLARELGIPVRLVQPV